MKTLLLFVSILLALMHGAWAEDVRFSKDRFFASEFAHKARVTIERTGPVDSALAVRVTTTNGSATSVADYELFDSLVTLPAGTASINLEITLPDDALPESDETFRLAISDLPPGATSTRPGATVVILDNERPGSIDRAWSSTLGLTGNELARAQPMSVIPLPGGKLIVAVAIYDDEFLGLVGVRLLRLNADASIDTTYPMREIEPSEPGNKLMWCDFMPLPDDGLLITRSEDTGGFWIYNSVHSRLRADGSFDASFPTISNNHEGGRIQPLVQPDGKLLVYCQTGTLVEGGATSPLFMRFNPDSSVDASFAPVTDIIGNLDFQYWLLADGKLLLGAWSGVGGTYQLRRLTANGAPDPSFQSAMTLNSGTAPRIYPLSDGQILNCSNPTLQRLRQDGSDDRGFRGNTAGVPFNRGSGVDQVIELEGGKLLLAGRFTQYKGVTVNGIVRILANGNIDPDFHSGRGFELNSDPNARSVSLRALSGGRFLVEGIFDRYNGQPATPFIVLNPDGTQETSFESPGELEWIWGFAPVYLVTVAGDQILVWTPEGLSRLVPPVAAGPPRLVSIERTGDAIRLIVAVRAGDRYTLETSPDLDHWSAAASQTAASTQLEFTDTPPAGTTRRFYRVAQE